MLWYERGDVSPLWELAPEEMLCLDVETTGLKAGFDEVLQLALVRGDDLMLMNGLFGTERRDVGRMPSMCTESLRWMSTDCLHLECAPAKSLQYCRGQNSL